MPRQILTILLINAPTIDDPCVIAGFLRHSLREPLADRGVGFLGLGSRGNFTGADGPDGLVGDDDLGPVLDFLSNSVELLGYD